MPMFRIEITVFPTLFPALKGRFEFNNRQAAEGYCLKWIADREYKPSNCMYRIEEEPKKED